MADNTQQIDEINMSMGTCMDILEDKVEYASLTPEEQQAVDTNIYTYIRVAYELQKRSFNCARTAHALLEKTGKKAHDESIIAEMRTVKKQAQ